MLHKTLSKHFLFYNLTKHQRSHLIKCFDIYECPKNTIVFSKGNTGKKFFVIHTGTVKVEAEDKNIILKRGNYFGDLALVYASLRSATVTT